VVVEILNPTAGPFPNDTTPIVDSVFVAAIPLLVTNRGGRDVALIGIRPDEVFPWISTARDDSLNREPALSHRVFFTRGTLDRNDVTPTGLQKLEYRTARQMELVSIPVQSGHSEIFTFGVYVDSYRKARELAEYLLIAANFKFSDGTEFRLRQGVATVPRPAF
jgi:hypothetical protein